MLSPNPQAKGPVPRHTPLLIQGLEALGYRITRRNWGQTGETESAVRKILDRWQAVGDVTRTLSRHPDIDMIIVKTAHDWKTLMRDIPLLKRTSGKVAHRILQFHGSSPDRTEKGWFFHGTRMLLNNSEGALVLSTEEQLAFGARFPGASMEVVKNPFIPLQQKDWPPRTLETIGTPRRLLYTGRILREKGVFQILESVSRLENAVVQFVGEGPALNELRRETEAFGLESRVQFTGYLSGPELAAAYQQADLMVFPSYWSEGLPSVLLEAMQAGLPVVTTKIRGAADYFREGEGACFVPPRDVAALTQVLQRLLNSPEEMLRMGLVNRGKLAEFSLDNVVQEYADAIERLAAGN